MSRTLILMRHGEAAAPAGTSDHERPLTDRGTEQAAAAGAWIAESLPPVRAVLCSTSLRTRQTLDAVADGATRFDASSAGILSAAPEASFAHALYGAAPEGVLGEIALTDADAPTLLVIGHFPGLPETALALDPAGPRSAEVRRGLPAAGCIVLRSDMPWDTFPDALRGAATPFAGIRRVRTP